MMQASLKIPIAELGNCLMPNHVHIAIQPHERGHLAKWVHRVTTMYAMYFNRTYGKQGHVFQGRYFSEPILEEEDLPRVLQYIERNPLAAGLVRRAEDWEWSSLRLRGAPNRAVLEYIARDYPAWLEAINAPRPSDAPYQGR